MAKYDGWTLGETEALLNVVGGVDKARAVLRGEYRLTVGAIAQQQPVAPALVGTLVKTLRLDPYQATSVAEAIKLGKYDGVDDDIVTLFARDKVGLTEAVSVDLFRFDRNWLMEEALAWAEANSNKKPIEGKHLHGIGIQHHEEQRQAPIVELGSVRGGDVLCLRGNSDWRGLHRDAVRGLWARRYLVGFLSE